MVHWGALESFLFKLLKIKNVTFVTCEQFNSFTQSVFVWFVQLYFLNLVLELGGESDHIYVTRPHKWWEWAVFR